MILWEGASAVHGEHLLDYRYKRIARENAVALKWHEYAVRILWPNEVEGTYQNNITV